jgi:hypothetical protein
MRRSRSFAVPGAAALAVACMTLVVATPLADAQGATPSTSPGSDCEIRDRGELRLRVGPGEASGYDVAEGVDLTPAWLDDQRDQVAAKGPGDRLDLVTGTELLVAASEYDIETGESRPIAVTSVDATLDLDDAPPIWLATDVGDHGAWVIRMPTAETRRWRRRITGEGILAARLGLCDGSSQSVYGRVEVVGPGSIADCAVTWQEVRPYVDGLDLRVRVGRSIVPEREIRGVHGRYNDPPPFVGSASYEGVRYRPATPRVRIRAGEELHVRHVDRDIDLVEPRVQWLDPPPARQLRDGLVNSNVNPRTAEVRPDGYGGYRVRTPTRPGRYMLEDSSTWMNHCVEITEGPMLVMVEVR